MDIQQLASTAQGVQRRRFDEWIAITARPERAGPVRAVMTALADAGQSAGIALSHEGGSLTFEHTWLLVTCELPDA